MYIQSSKKVSTDIGWCYIHYYIRECDSTLYLGLTTLPIGLIQNELRIYQVLDNFDEKKVLHRHPLPLIKLWVIYLSQRVRDTRKKKKFQKIYQFLHFLYLPLFSLQVETQYWETGRGWEAVNSSG